MATQKCSRILALVTALLLSSSSMWGGTNESRDLYVPDGQLQSHLFRVYVDQPLNWTNTPLLKLWGAHALTRVQRGEGVPMAPLVIAPQQAYERPRGEGTITATGTMLLFDLRQRQLMHWFKGSVRVTPVLEWHSGGMTNVVASPVAVNVGRIAVASAWMGVFVLALAAAIAVLSFLKAHSVMALLVGEDGHGSLSRLQLTLWTVVVGFSIGVFGVIRATLPDIPMSVVTLMGLSLVTGGVSYYAVTKDGKPEGKVPLQDRRFQFADLICTYDSAGKCELSIAKAQMLFWTGMALLLFCVKTFLNGQLWDVPAELVVLTGMSQTAYVGPKFWKPGRQPSAGGGSPGASPPAAEAAVVIAQQHVPASHRSRTPGSAPAAPRGAVPLKTVRSRAARKRRSG